MRGKVMRGKVYVLALILTTFRSLWHLLPLQEPLKKSLNAAELLPIFRATAPTETKE